MKSSITRILALSFFPAALFSVGIVYAFITGPYFLRGVDPEYAYLLNGLLIADLKLDLGFIYHPGTPVQCIAAIVMRIVHVFRPGNTLVHDVMLNPEMYIKFILFTVITLNALTLFCLGYLVYRKCQNMYVAIFLQLTPFAHVLTLEVLRRLMPEPLMNIFICGWILLIIQFIYNSPGELNSKRYALWSGILFGISLADKLTFLPFFIIPLILLPEWKNKVLYVLYSVGAFLIFAFPVTLKIAYFYNWVKDITLHTGSYGGGEKGFFKWNEFKDHLGLHFSNTGILAGVVLILLLITIIRFLVYRKFQFPMLVRIKAAIAIILVIAVEYLISSKHFAFHYIIPAILLTITCILLIVLVLKDMFPGIVKPVVMNIMLIIAGTIILANTTPGLIKHIKQIRQISVANLTAFNRIEPLLKTTPKIISASYYGCSSIEYALTCGIHESGRYSNYLTFNFNELFPETYIYLPWGKVFYQGNRVIQPSGFIDPAERYNLYVADYSEKALEEVRTALLNDLSGHQFSIVQIYSDTIQHEGVFMVQFLNNK